MYVPSARRTEELIFGEGVNLRRIALVEAEGKLQDLPTPGGSPATGKVLQRRSGSWEVGLPPTGGLLTVAERYHPGWSARSGDGRELATLSANFVQLGVVVPAGIDRVSLHFRPPGLLAGILCGLASLAVLSLLFVLGRARPETPSPTSGEPSSAAPAE